MTNTPERDTIKTLHVGNIVRRKDRQVLRSGCEPYGAAVVISVEPFILASQHADMRWSSTVKIEDFEPVGEANPSTLAKCITRLEG